MNRCVECGEVGTHRYEHICSNCFQKKLRENPEVNRAAQVNIESAENRWF